MTPFEWMMLAGIWACALMLTFIANYLLKIAKILTWDAEARARERSERHGG